MTRHLISTVHAGIGARGLFDVLQEALAGGVDVGSLLIDKKKKCGQIRKYQQKRVDKVKSSLMANPPEEPVTVTTWQSPHT